MFDPGSSVWKIYYAAQTCLELLYLRRFGEPHTSRYGQLVFAVAVWFLSSVTLQLIQLRPPARPSNRSGRGACAADGPDERVAVVNRRFCGLTPLAVTVLVSPVYLAWLAEQLIVEAQTLLT